MVGIDIEVRMKSGKEFHLKVEAKHISQITTFLNKNKFITFGSIILNSSEIEYIKEVAE